MTISATRSALPARFAKSGSVATAASSAPKIKSGRAMRRAIESASSACPRDTSSERLCASANAERGEDLAAHRGGRGGHGIERLEQKGWQGMLGIESGVKAEPSRLERGSGHSRIVTSLTRCSNSLAERVEGSCGVARHRTRAAEVEQEIGTSAQVELGSVAARDARSEEFGCRRAIATFECEPGPAVQCGDRLRWALLPRPELVLQTTERRPDVRADLQVHRFAGAEDFG